METNETDSMEESNEDPGLVRELTLDEMLAKPLNELTPDQAEQVIAWRVEQKTRERAYTEAQARQSKMMQEIAATHQAAADHSMELVDRLTAAAIKKLEGTE